MDDFWNRDDFEIIDFARSEPEVFSCPDDAITCRFKENLESIMETVEDGWDPFAVTWGDTNTPAQRPINDPVLSDISRQCDAPYLQLDLFADHPEALMSWPREGIGPAALDLLGAAVIEWSDCRESHLVADLVGLLRRGHYPVEQITDLAVSMFRLVALIAGSQKVTVWEAHGLFLKQHRLAA